MTVHALPPAINLADPASLAIDLNHPEAQDVVKLVEAFRDDAKTKPDLGPLPVTEGWNDITPEIAVNLLRRNRQNRRVEASTVQYYATQMKRGDWKPTGQPILIDANGHLVDAQHRLYGVLLSGTTIRSYVVTNIEVFEHMFAYIDNARPRTAASALETAGFNGVSAVIAKIIKIAEEVKYHVYNPSGPSKLPRMAPKEVLNLAAGYPNVEQAAHELTSGWRGAMSLINKKRKEIVGYLGMRIIDLHGGVVADQFFEDLADLDTPRAPDDPITVMQKHAEKDRQSRKPMEKKDFLAVLIKAFNAWQTQQAVTKSLMPRVNDDLPLIEGEVPARAAVAV